MGKIRYEILADKRLYTPARVRTLHRLFRAVFQDFPVSPDEYKAQIHLQREPMTVLAYDGKKLVGAKHGYRKGSRRFSSQLGGVLKSHRGRGIGRTMMEIQHQRCKEMRHIDVIVTESTNRFTPMLILNLRYGFEIVGTYYDNALKTLKIMFEKQI